LDALKTHGRFERRTIGGLSAKAAGIAREWPAVRQICPVRRCRWQKANGTLLAPQEECVDLIISLTAAILPQALSSVNRNHWGVVVQFEYLNLWTVDVS